MINTMPTFQVASSTTNAMAMATSERKNSSFQFVPTPTNPGAAIQLMNLDQICSGRRFLSGGHVQIDGSSACSSELLGNMLSTI
jgi:hypothetical protein